MPDVTLPKGAIPTLETERMRLRPHRLQDLDACVAMWADPVVTRHIGQGSDVFLLWDFHFRANGLRRRDNRIRGATHLQLAPDGRIAAHRDYWDAAQELYEEVPVLGAFMRWLKRRAAA